MGRKESNQTIQREQSCLDILALIVIANATNWLDTSVTDDSRYLEVHITVGI